MTESGREDLAAQPVAQMLDSDSRARRLIAQAFEQAHRSGRADWQTMTIAVLKNRLLILSDRSFHEKDYGARSISEFVRRYPDLVLLDDSTTPPTVHVLSPAASKLEVDPAGNSRIRSDLWSSVVDYQSGLTYIWDGITAQPTDPSNAQKIDQDRILPTLTVGELDNWRQEFLNSVQPIIGDDANALEQTQRWVRNRLGTIHLPASLRTPWNQAMKRQVIDRLVAWFATHKLVAPKDLLQARPASRDQAIGASTLRQLILRCVQVMTEDELRQINLPPSAVLRAYGTAVPGRSHGVPST